MKTYAQINDRIESGKAVVLTADEIMDYVEDKGLAAAAEEVDVVTTATFGPMCSSGCVLNFGHSKPKIRMSEAWVQDVLVYTGLAAVDVYLGATQLRHNDPANMDHPGEFRYGGGHVMGPSLFMHVVGAADAPATARFELPDGWRLNGAIAPSSADPHLISADSYHELIDAPMLIGRFDQIEFEVEGVPHLIAILGPHNADLERLRDEFTRIVEACSQLFGGLPYERYAFIFTTLTGGGGIEHDLIAPER